MHVSNHAMLLIVCVSFNKLLTKSVKSTSGYINADLWYDVNASWYICLSLKLVYLLNIYRKNVLGKKATTINSRISKKVVCMWIVSWGLILLTYHTSVFIMCTLMNTKSKKLTLRKILFIPIRVDIIHPYKAHFLHRNKL